MMKQNNFNVRQPNMSIIKSSLNIKTNFIPFFQCKKPVNIIQDVKVYAGFLNIYVLNNLRLRLQLQVLSCGLVS